MKRPFLKLTGLLLATTFLAGCWVIEWSEFGTPPDEERLNTFASSEQFNINKLKFENRRPGLIDKDRDEAMNPEFILSWFQGGEDSAPTEKLPEARLDLNTFLATKDKFQFVWLGHSSLLMNVNGTIVLVDPVFSNNVAPVSFSSKRFQPLAIDPEDISKVDVVLISHDHYDHLDMETVQHYQDSDVTFITTLGVGSHLQGWGIDANNIVEKDWSESFQYNDIKFTAAPSQHFSGRGLSDTNKTLWASWIISTDKHNVFFSGDSGYDDHFIKIGQQYGPFGLAFMENGQYDDRFKAAHMLPEEVAVAYKELNANRVFPIHWGMFALNMHAWYEPPKRLLDAVEHNDDVITPLIGYVYDLDGLPSLERWWEAYSKNR